MIAGLKWPPEMWPTAEAMTPMTSPCASAIRDELGAARLRDGDRPDADEDEREDADELRGGPTHPVPMLHGTGA